MRYIDNGQFYWDTQTYHMALPCYQLLIDLCAPSRGTSGSGTLAWNKRKLQSSVSAALEECVSILKVMPNN